MLHAKYLSTFGSFYVDKCWFISTNGVSGFMNTTVTGANDLALYQDRSPAAPKPQDLPLLFWNWIAQGIVQGIATQLILGKWSRKFHRGTMGNHLKHTMGSVESSF